MILFKTLENSVEKLEDWISKAKLHGWDPLNRLKSTSLKYLTLIISISEQLGNNFLTDVRLILDQSLELRRE